MNRTQPTKLGKAKHFCVLLLALFAASQSFAQPIQQQIIKPAIKILPVVTDFGRVRLHQLAEKGFLIEDTGAASLVISNVSFNPPLSSTDFTVGSFSSPIESKFLDSIPTSFKPQTEGPQSVTISIANNDPGTPVATAVLQGIGVYPKVTSGNLDFGSVRVGKTSRLDSFVIRSVGTDTTSIESITAVGNTDFTIFTQKPSPSSPLLLGAADVVGGVKEYYFTANFHPSLLGPRMLILQIHSADTAVHDILDTLFGVGVLPLIEAEPATIVFPTIYAPRLPDTVAGLDARFVVHNRHGSMKGIIDSLVSRDTAHYFTYTFGRTSDIRGEVLPLDDSEEVFVHFKATEAGDFIDTVTIFNDSPNLPKVAIKASVRSDTVDYIQITRPEPIRDCTPFDTTIVLTNPNSVSVSIDTVYFKGDTAGFSYTDPFLFPINIDTGAQYPLKIRYVFPADSLNGAQTLRLQMQQHAGNTEELKPVILETSVTVSRDIRLIQLTTEAPSYTPSAGDAMPFRLPITVIGDRVANTELNDFELRIKFDNDLFQVIGIDRTGSLTEKTSSGDPADVTGTWDAANSTYVIRASNVHVADPNFASNNLLVTLLVRSFVTPDTSSIIVPEFVFQRRPCAYALAKHGVTLSYANDCGDPALRGFFNHSSPDLIVQPVRPDPLTGQDRVLKLDVKARRALTADWSITDMEGKLSKSAAKTMIPAGPSTLRIPLPENILSGAHMLTLQTIDPVSGNISREFVKFRVLK